MSVLIKGVEMPQSCHQCVAGYGGFCFVAPPETDGKCPHEGRSPWCPIVTIPPHGDLIDRDVLSKSLDKLCDRVCQYSKAQRRVMCGACPLGDAFAVVEDDAPTIIEAEGDMA